MYGIAFSLEQITSMGAGCSTETEMGPDNSFRNSSLHPKTAIPGVRNQESGILCVGLRVTLTPFYPLLHVLPSGPTENNTVPPAPISSNPSHSKRGQPNIPGPPLCQAKVLPLPAVLCGKPLVDAPSSLPPASGISPKYQCLFFRCSMRTGHLGYQCGLVL